ncbi:hypothetical protein E2C11_07330 [Streptomyces lavendulae]|nr:hypothetical protein [Streptomyces lavendulae]TXJ83283.1 hypothetical protein E2C11_07330 [Streptomyces lavendulae]
MTSKSSASDDLREAIGHYLNAVAEVLLRDGVPVKYVRASTDTRAAADDTSIATDVDGDIGFNISFERSLYPESESVELNWSGTSGWSLLPMVDGADGYYDGARWLGAGLVPPVDRVSSFMAMARLSPVDAGSSERPFYRQPDSDLTELHRRLAAFVPASTGIRTYGMCFTNMVQGIYTNRLSAALTAPDDTEVSVTFRPGELEALRHLLEYVQIPANGLLSAYARHLTEDLDNRRQFSATPSHQAVEVARSIRQQWRDRQQHGE